MRQTNALEVVPCFLGEHTSFLIYKIVLILYPIAYNGNAILI